MTLPDRRIITPAQAIERIRVRDRIPPKARAHAGIRGWIDWSLIDRSGREVAGGQQSNLFLDQGLELMPDSSGAYGPFDLGTNGGASNPASFFSHFVVGTSSTVPDAAQTALGAEVARVTSLISQSNTRTSNGVYELQVEREFGFGVGDGNLTEWGIANGATGRLLVRELFRDGVGDPITVVKTAAEKLRISYTCEVTLTPTVATAGSFVITNIGTINGTYRFLGGTGNFDISVWSNIIRGIVSTTGFGYGTNYGISSSPLAAYASDSYSNERNAETEVDIDAYVAGSLERVVSECRWSTATGNREWESMGWTRGNGQFGFAFQIDPADLFTKDNLHTMTITDPITVTWGRA